jgi:hypothetical protein
MNGYEIVLKKVYRAALHGASLRAPLLGEATGTQLRRFVASSTTFSNCLPGPQARSCPQGLQTRRICISLSEKRFLQMVGALVLNAAPASEPNGKNIKFRAGLTLWLRVLALLSQREAEWIEDCQ